MDQSPYVTLQPLIDEATRIKVSSTLDKSVGKKHLIDGSYETCWTSQQGLPQFIHLVFNSPVMPKVVHITFQGGFVGKHCLIQVDSVANERLDQDYEGRRSNTSFVDFTTIYPEDVNRKQSFELPRCNSPVNEIKFVFEESSDFFGRITIYDLQVEGHPASSL